MSLIDCDNEYYDDKHCLYAHSKYRDKNWKFFELKIDIAKNWNKNKNFVFVNKRQKKLRKNNFFDVVKKIKNTSSLSFNNFFFHFLLRNKFVKFRQKNEKYKINNVRKIHRIIDRNSKFYLNNEIDNHIFYDKSLFNEIKSMNYIKQIKMTIETYVDVKKIKFIIMNLNINDKKIINTIIDVKYVSNIQYNLIATNLLYRKNCKIIHDDEIYIFIDVNTNDIFLIDIIQNFKQKNFYIVNKWINFKIKIKKNEKNIWMQWHRRFNHLNIKYVKKFVVMNLIDDDKCNKLHNIESFDLCENCIMNKMHKTFNKQTIKTNLNCRVIKKN